METPDIADTDLVSPALDDDDRPPDAAAWALSRAVVGIDESGVTDERPVDRRPPEVPPTAAQIHKERHINNSKQTPRSKH